MSQARGFAVGGAFHVVVNNQIGFTTSNPQDARSTLHCTEVAKMVKPPILQVNADDPEAVVFATRVLSDFRREFNKDVVLDLVCYRRLGHNEADEPAATQPRMYAAIRKLDSVPTQYAKQLAKEGLVDKDAIRKADDRYREKLDSGEPVIELLDGDEAIQTVDWKPYLDAEDRKSTRLNSSHVAISYAVFCLKKK